MIASNRIHRGLVAGLLVVIAFGARAEVAEYTLEDVILDDGGVQMFGTFSWTYEVGDFENGAGQFTFLEIPYTNHDHTDLDTVVDVGSSIEITLAGSVHDDGVDITLFLVQPLTPDTGAAVDLSRSRYEIGGNGFHDGLFLSGRIVPSGATDAGDISGWLATTALAAYPNPFNPATTLSFDLQRGARVRIEICDALGRVVRTLVDGEYREAGRVETTWRGRDDNGRTLPSGLYFARIEAEDRVSRRKLMLLK